MRRRRSVLPLLAVAGVVPPAPAGGREGVASHRTGGDHIFTLRPGA